MKVAVLVGNYLVAIIIVFGLISILEEGTMDAETLIVCILFLGITTLNLIYAYSKKD